MWTQHRGYIAACYPERVLALLLVASVALDVDIEDPEENWSMNVALAALGKALGVEG